MGKTDTNRELLSIRKDILSLVAKSGGHLGGSFSSVEALYVLYKYFVSEDQNDFILSKGHAVQVLYAVLKKFGVIDTSTFNSYGEFGTKLVQHPSIYLKGVSYSSGALGNGLSVGIGMALSNKLDKNKRHVFVLMGDGEINEGSVWEGFMYAGAKKVSRLVAFIDYNGLQASDKTKNIINSEPLFLAIKSLGWQVDYVDGHNIYAIKESIRRSLNSKIPVTIILNTIKGKGISFMENNVEWHHKNPTEKEVEIALKEINA